MITDVAGLGDVGEVAADEHLAVGLEDHRAHGLIRSGTGIEGGIQRAIAVQPGDVVHHRVIRDQNTTDHHDVGEDDAERTADQQLPIRLRHDGEHRAVGNPRRRIEPEVVPRRRVVVENADGRIAERAQLRPGGRIADAEGDGEGLGPLDQAVVDDRDDDEAGEDARRENERAAGRHVIRAGDGGAIKGLIIDEYGSGGPRRADHGEHRIRRVLEDRVSRGGEGEGAGVVGNGEGGRRKRPEGDARAGQREDERHGLGTLDDIVQHDGHVEDVGENAGAEDDRAVGRHIVRARGGGADAGGDIHRHRAVRGPEAHERDVRGPGGLAHRVAGQRKADLRVVVEDRHGGRAERTERGDPGGLRVAQEDGEGFVILRQRVVPDDHAEGLGGFAGGKGQASAVGLVITRGERGAVGGSEIHRDRGGVGAGAQHRDHGRTRGLADEEIGRREEEAAVVVEDGQEGGVGEAQLHAVGRERIQQAQIHGAIAVHGGVANDRHEDVAEDFAGAKGERVGEAGVVAAVGGRAVARGDLERDRRVRVAGPHHEHMGVARVFIHDEAVGAEGEDHVVVHDGEDRVGHGSERRTEARIEEGQADLFVRLEPRIVDDGHQEIGGLHRRDVARPCGGEDERTVGDEIVNARDRGDVRHDEVHGGAAAVQARAPDGDDGIGLAFTDPEGGGRKLEATAEDDIIHDGQRRRRQPEGRATGRVREREVQRFVALDQLIRENRHGEGLDDFAVREGQRALREDEVHIRPAHHAADGPVGHRDRGVIHRHRARAAEGAHHREGRGPAGLEHRERVGGEAEGAAAAVVINDDQGRVGELTGERKTSERGGDGQPEGDRLVALDQAVVGDRHGEGGAGLAVGERHGGQDHREIRPGEGGAVGAGGDIDRQVLDHAARAHDRDDGVADILGDAVNRGAEAHETVFFLNQNRGVRDRVEDGTAARIGQVQHDGLVGPDDVVVEQPDRKIGGGLAFGEDEDVGGQGDVINVRNRRPAGDVERHGDLAERAARAGYDDHRVRGALADREHGLAERQRAAAEIVAAQQPGEVVVRRAVETGEGTAQQNLPVALHGQRGDQVVRARPDIQRRVQRTVRVQAGDAAAADAVHVHKGAAEKHLAVRLHGDRRDRVIRTRAGEEAGVERAIGIEPHDAARVGLEQRSASGQELAAHEHLAIGLNGDGVHRAGDRESERNEARIKRAVGIEAGEMIAIGQAVHRGEIAADDDLAIVLNRDRAHRAVGTDLRIEGGVQPAGGRQARHEAAVGGVHGRESTADHRAAIRLHGDGVNPVVGTAQGVREGGIDGPVDIQPRDMVQRASADGIEETGHDHLTSVETVRVWRDRANRGHAGGERNHARVEALVQRAIVIHARHPRAGNAVEGIELTADDQLPVPLQAERVHDRVRPEAVGVGRINGPGRAFVVRDPHQRIGQARDRAGEAEEADLEETRAVLNRVVEERDGKGLRGLAVGEQQEPAGPGVIPPVHRGAVQRGVTHPHDAGRTIGPHDGDQGVGAVLDRGKHRLGKPERARQEVLVGDRHKRPAGRANAGAAGHIRQHQLERPVPVHEGVVDQRHPDEFAAPVQIPPHQNAAHRDVVVGGRDGLVGRRGRAGNRRVKHRHCVGQTAEALDLDHRVARRFVHHVVRGREDQTAEAQLIVVHDRQHRPAGRPEHRAAARVGE